MENLTTILIVFAALACAVIVGNRIGYKTGFDDGYLQAGEDRYDDTHNLEY